MRTRLLLIFTVLVGIFIWAILTGGRLLVILTVLTVLVLIGAMLSQRLQKKWETTNPQRSQMIWRVTALLGIVITVAMVILALQNN